MLSPQGLISGLELEPLSGGYRTGTWLWKLEYWVNKRNGGENQQTSGRWLWKVQEQEVNCNSLDAQDSYWKRFRSNRTNNEAAVQEGVSGSLPGSYYY